MSASFTLALDVQAPASPTLVINDGSPTTGEQPVWVTLSTADYTAGANDVEEVKIWGDVTSGADARIGTEESASTWIAFAPSVPVLLSAGAGRKTIYAKLKDDVGNETLVFSDFIDLNLTLPVVTVTTGVDRGRISKIASFNVATFTWQPDRPIITYEVRVVPSAGSPHQSGVPIGTTGGSVNTSSTSRVEASQSVITSITGADLEAASPGSTRKVIKVFVRSVDGVWSA